MLVAAFVNADLFGGRYCAGTSVGAFPASLPHGGGAIDVLASRPERTIYGWVGRALRYGGAAAICGTCVFAQRGELNEQIQAVARAA